MRVLVTGANGYLGKGVVQQLQKDGVDVIATDITDTNLFNNYKKADLFAIEDPYNYFDKPEIVLHLAWRNGFQHNSFSHLEDFPKHYMFLQKMAQSGIKQMSVLGSMHEIGFFEGSINEHTSANPENLYGISKNALRKAIELLCKQYNIVYQWIRGYYIVGNTPDGCSIFSKIVQAENHGDSTFPFTQGMNQYDFIDYDNFCIQVAAAVQQTEVDGIINCCSGMPMKLSERVEKFIKENNYKIKLEYGAFPDRPYDSKAVWGNDEKIKRILMNRKNQI